MYILTVVHVCVISITCVYLACGLYKLNVGPLLALCHLKQCAISIPRADSRLVLICHPLYSLPILSAAHSNTPAPANIHTCTGTMY